MHLSVNESSIKESFEEMFSQKQILIKKGLLDANADEATNDEK